MVLSLHCFRVELSLSCKTPLALQVISKLHSDPAQGFSNQNVSEKSSYLKQILPLLQICFRRCVAQIYCVCTCIVLELLME